MSDLKLVPANESREDGHWSDDDYDVVLVDTGETVGRIYARTGSGSADTWWWGLAFGHQHGPEPKYGIADSKAEAKAAFAKRWRQAP